MSCYPKYPQTLSSKKQESNPAKKPKTSKQLMFWSSSKPRAQPPLTVQQKKGKYQYLIAYMAKYKRQKLDRHDQDLGKEPNIKLTQPIRNLVVPDKKTLSWKAELNTPTKLWIFKFDQPHREHLVTQEECAETVPCVLIKSDYLDN